MASLPSQKRILREDLTEAPIWIDKLLWPLNKFMETIYYALDKNITFEDNIAAQKRTINFTTGTYIGSPMTADNFPLIQFTSTLRTVPAGIMLLNIYESDNIGEPLIEPTTLSWYYNNGTITVTYITGLSDDTDYTMTLLVI